MAEIIFSTITACTVVLLILILKRKRIKDIPKYWTDYDENIYS